MRISKLLFAICFLPFAVSAQSNVDKLIDALDSHSRVVLNNWKYSTNLKEDATKPGFDDSNWETLKLNESIYPDSCWLRREVVLPQRFLGEPVSGPVRFLVSVDDYGYLWVNGESKGHFPWNGEFELTQDAKPGQKFVLVIKAINTGGPLRLLRAQIEPEKSKPLRQHLDSLSLSLRVGQKLLSFDTYQTNARVKTDPGIDNSAMDRAEKIRLINLLQNLAAKVDIQALADGKVNRFKASLEDMRTQLKPIADYVKRFTLFFDANAHIDAAWLWREKETIEVCKNTFASVLNMMGARPDFTYTQSSAAYYDWMERLYHEIFRDIQARVKDGRWEVVGGMWVEPDCNLPSGESWARHLLYAKRYFKQKLGIDVKIGWNPDSFGYNWNMPQFYANAGIDAFITQKIGWNDTNVFPHRLFWWEGPDGSRILAYFPFDYVNTVDNPYRLVDWLRQYEANTGMTKMMILFGVGDHGGGPSLEMLDRIERLKTLDIYPNIEYGTAAQYLAWLKQQNLEKIPVWRDELYLEYHQGTFTTQAKMKEYNRRSEELLTNAEKFSTLATLFGGSYSRADLAEAWQHVLFNQFHDILPGSSIREVYLDAPERYQTAHAIATFELKNAFHRISDKINTTKIKKGIPVVIFNPLAWERSEVVTIHLPEGDFNDYAVFDLDGREMPSQIFQQGKYKREMIFWAKNVPSLGYTLYELRKQKPTPQTNKLSISTTTLENEFFRITVDPDAGWIKSIFDKRHGKEILTGYGNELQILEDKPSAWDAWNIGLTGVKYPSKFRRVEIVENGPVRAILRITRDYLRPGVKKDFPTEDFPSTFFTQDVILYDGGERIDFRTEVDWWEDKTMLKVAFPVAVQDTVATYEIPYGTIQRSTQMRNSWEKAKVEVPAQRWADLSQSDYGVSLLNRSKYGHDIKGNIMRLSLLRSPKWPDPTADRGKHVIEYVLYPHANGWREAGTVRRGYEYNNPLMAVLGEVHRGELSSVHSFVQLTPRNLVLTTIKKAEDSEAWVFQWYESEGKDTQALLRLPQIPEKVVASNFLEEDGETIGFDKTMVQAQTKKNAVVTLKVYF
ncbi:MAG: glycosyl hydrolase-related protein [candidate division KSB1 bacterium]|nr:glycosyl hydrolase-related protein [candidate division KSB1 bacterium]MDZ7303293.1 glycosyl hydrolase-related protein [candidate division KSB1 bacterium]MDZ7312596.1 glycosyl hydrolase-related protein [candidate division KSB1 bacterium]